MRQLPILIAAAAFMLAGVAEAHPKLVSANPAPNATIAKPAHVQLRFSEKLIPAFSKADLTMLAAPGMSAMKVATAAAVAPDGRTLVVTPKAPLRAGRYAVIWHVVSTDTHKVAGHYGFAVK